MEKITILTDGKEYEVEAIVALSELGESADGYRALIPTCLLIG
jgi:hypothetical protein